MILLNEIAKKLESVLNGTDIETMEFSRPTDFEFAVETSGYHLDHIYDKVTGKNFLPVFVSSMGGSYDPVIGVKRNTYNVSVTIYFPVSFKEQMYALNEYLVNCFVGTQRNYGAMSGKCLSNISVPEYGEIQDLDLNQFQSWVQNVYQKRIDVMQPYMTMTFVLYLVNAGGDFIFGNSVDYTLKFQITETLEGNNFETLLDHSEETGDFFLREPSEDYHETYFAWRKIKQGQMTQTIVYTLGSTPIIDAELFERYGDRFILIPRFSVGPLYHTYTGTVDYIQKLKWTSAGTGVDNSPASQQLINVDKFAKNVVNITNYSKSIAAYIEDNEFWKKVLDLYNNQSINDIESMTLTKTYNLKSGIKEYNYNQVALSINENIALGDLLSMTITFGDKI